MTLRRTSSLAFTVFALLVSGCHARRGEDNGGVPGDVDSAKPFSGIAATETLHVLGTEPFWGGEVRGGTFSYSTPATPGGTEIKVSRFAGRNGLGLSGTLDDKTLDMTVTPGTCSDGMSDRTFPFTVTLKLGEDVRQGCGWTDRQRFNDKVKG